MECFRLTARIHSFANVRGKGGGGGGKHTKRAGYMEWWRLGQLYVREGYYRIGSMVLFLSDKISFRKEGKCTEDGVLMIDRGYGGIERGEMLVVLVIVAYDVSSKQHALNTHPPEWIIVHQLPELPQQRGA